MNPTSTWLRRRPLLVAAVLGLGLLAACGDDTAGDTGTDHDEHDGSDVAEGGARTFAVDASSFEFDPAEITVSVGEDIAIELSSDDIEHDFTIDELDAHVAADAGDTASGGLRAEEAGEFTYYCSVDGHREAGMEGTLIVA